MCDSSLGKPVAFAAPRVHLTMLRLSPLCALPSAKHGAFGFLRTRAHVGVVGRAFSSSMPCSSDNPLLGTRPASLPCFSHIEADHVVPAVETVLDEFIGGLEELEASITSQSGQQLPGSGVSRAIALTDAMERNDDALSRVWGTVTHLQGVANTPELRAAHDAVQGKVVEASMRASQSEVIYQETKDIVSRPEFAEVDGARQRVLSQNLLQSEHAGVGLVAAEKERFGEIMVELARLSSTFSNNVIDASAAWEMVLTSPADVEGMPPAILEAAAQSAAANGHDSATADLGPWRFSLDAPSFQPFMEHCRRKELREEAYCAYMTRASAGSEWDNEPLIQEILTLRSEKAAMLGYDNFAQLSLASKMAGSVEEVVDMVEGLRSKCYPTAERELQELRAFAGDDDIQPWDVPFWAERLKEARFDISDEELRPYFPLDRVLHGMFQLASRLFGVHIVETPQNETEVWHPDVRFFKVVSDNDGSHVASFFLDPYCRAGTKRGGAWMDVCLGRSAVLGDHGEPRIPVAYLVCNSAPAVGSKPSQMTLNEVTTLFHEFGHGLQHMLTTVNVGGAAGISGVEWDAVELPSQFMEHWCFLPETLANITCHETTGDSIPTELVQRIIAARQYRAASAMLRQCYFARLDMELHMQRCHGGAPALDPFAIQAEVDKTHLLLPPVPDADRFLCSFLHIFAGGYSAGYYSYKWAEVMAADAFAAFKEAGPEEEQNRGALFRDTVLGMGGSKHPAEVFREFRGRDPSIEPLLEVYGLEK